MTPELKDLVAKAETIIAEQIETITDLEDRRRFITTCDDLLAALAILYRDAKGLFKELLARISTPFKASRSKGDIENIITLKIEDVLGEQVKSGLQGIMSDEFNANELAQKQGMIIYSNRNMKYILKHLKHVDLAFDDFSREMMFKQMPWPVNSSNNIIQIQKPQIGFVDEEAPGASILHPYTEYNEENLKTYLNEHVYPAEYRWFGFQKMALAAAQAKPKFDSYQHWLHQLPAWDNVNYKDWMIKVCGVKVNTKEEYDWVCLIGMKFLPLAMVSRCLIPGIHARIVPIFEGDQNIGKSRLVKRFAFIPQAYVKVDLSDGWKEARRTINGKAVAEFADLGSVDRVNQNRLKDFISDEDNNVRRMHLDSYNNPPRRVIFILTVNDDVAGYLVDTTGNTRFANIKFYGRVDMDLFDQIKMQLFAQALHIFNSAKSDHDFECRPWTTPEEEALQAKMIVGAERHYREYEICERYVELNAQQFIDIGVTTKDIIQWARLGENFERAMSHSRSDKSYMQTFVKGMKRLGYIQKPFNNASGFRGNQKPNIYWVPADWRGSDSIE